MIILVSEINFSNFLLYFMLSFIYPIKAYKIQSFLFRFKGRIELLDLSDYFDWEKCILIKDEAVKNWQKIISEFPVSMWRVRVRGNNIDLSLKAKQDFQKEIEKLLFLKEIALQYKGKVCIIDSLKWNFLSKINRAKSLFCYPTIKLLSVINVLLDRLDLLIVNFLFFAKMSYQFIYGAIFNKKIKKRVKYIYDGVSPRELQIDKDKITFSWIIDEELISKEEILFLLPTADFQMRAHAKDYLKDKKLLTTTHFAIFRFASFKVLLPHFIEIVKILVKNILLPTFENSLKAGYLMRILKWSPIVESLKPNIYISTSSNLGSEDPSIIYFKTIGIKTVTWFYGTNCYFFLTQKKECNFRDVIFCNILSSTLVVWNKHFKEFINEHPQDGLKIEVMGPLMSGNEEVMALSKQMLSKKIGFSYKEKTKYIAIFDSPPVVKSYRGNYAWCPDCNSEEYNYLFLRDTYKLLQDFKEIVLIYKPKRSLTSGKFSYSAETQKLFKKMQENPRVVILDYNINPWVPIAIADICISMPFESPTVVSWHYQKPALFHDPLNIVLYHRYQVLSELISHNYNELKLKVHYWLFEDKKIADLPCIQDFQGLRPGENSSNRFRKYLNSLIS